MKCVLQPLKSEFWNPKLGWRYAGSSDQQDSFECLSVSLPNVAYKSFLCGALKAPIDKTAITMGPNDRSNGAWLFAFKIWTVNNQFASASKWISRLKGVKHRTPFVANWSSDHQMLTKCSPNAHLASIKRFHCYDFVMVVRVGNFKVGIVLGCSISIGPPNCSAVQWSPSLSDWARSDKLWVVLSVFVTTNYLKRCLVNTI